MFYTIEKINHSKQRYETPGDYSTDDNNHTSILVSEMGRPDSEFAIAIHELVESYLCRRDGVSDAEIDDFDVNFSKRSDASKYDEPGDCPDAPYHSQHKIALEIEKTFIKEIGDEWSRHNDHVLRFSQ